MTFQIHYDDAASAVVAALLPETGHTDPDRVLLVSDGVPISRAEICARARESLPGLSRHPAPDFTGGERTDGKRYLVSMARRVLKGERKFFQTPPDRS